MHNSFKSSFFFLFALIVTNITIIKAQNNALCLDGINDYVLIPDNDAIDFGVDDDFTVEVWIKVPSTPQPDMTFIDSDIIEKWSGSGGYPFVIRYLANTNKINVARYDGSISAGIVSSTSFNDDQWHHVAFVKNGEELLLYVDGVIEGTTTDSTVNPTSNNSELYLGCRGGFVNFFNGCIDDLRIWNYARSATQIFVNQEIEMPNPTPEGLVAYYKFDQGQPEGDNFEDLFVYDKSATSLAGSLLGFENLNGSYLEFDGIDDHVVIPDDDAIDFGMNENFTVEARLRIPSTSQPDLGNIDNDIIEKWSGSTSYPYVIRYINQGPNIGKISVGIFANPNNPGILSNATLNDDEWHHVAFVKDGVNLYLYIDGSFDGTAIDYTTASTENNSPLFLGRRGTGINKWQGHMDDLRIWNVARSETEIENNIGTMFTGSEAGLVSCFSFNEGPFYPLPNILLDSSPHNLNGNLNNFALSGSNSNWVGSGISYLVPTLGQWGIIICFLLLMIFGVIIFQTKKSSIFIRQENI